MADFSFFLPAGLESRMVIIPEISEASPTLKNIDVAKRKCYFMDERPLEFYRYRNALRLSRKCQIFSQQKCADFKNCLLFIFMHSKGHTLSATAS